MSTLLSKEAEDQIVDAITRVAQCVDDDNLHPTDAVVKVGQASRWPIEFVDRICQAYNTGRQEGQRQSHADILDKFASFPLADAQEVRHRLFGDGEKQAAEACEVSADYSKSPTWFQPLTYPPDVERQARGDALLAGLTKSAELAPDPVMTLKHRFGQLQEMEHEVEQLQMKAASAYESLASEIDKVRRYFTYSHVDRKPFSSVVKTASVYYGDAAVSMLNGLDTGALQVEKRLNKLTKHAAVLGAVDRTQAPFDSLEKLAGLARGVQAARQAHADMVAKTAAFKQELFSTRHDPPEPPRRDPFGSILPLEKAGTGFFTGAVMGAASGLGRQVVSGLPSSKTSDQLVEKSQRQLEDPAHEEELRNIRLKTTLTDMMSNDEVISGYDPDDVVKSFNEIQGLMPHVISQPIVLRSALRRALQGNLEPFELQQMLQMNAETIKARQPTAPTNNVLPNAPKSIFG